MRICIICHDLSNNAIFRSYILAKTLSLSYSVKVIGPIFGEGIWPPANTGEVDYQGVKARGWPFFANCAKRLLQMMDADILYAVTPQPTSFGLALIKKFKEGLPLFLDISDWEVGFYLDAPRWRRYKDALLHLHFPNAYPYLLLMEQMVHLADEITCVCTFLLQRFGGVHLPQGRDTNFLDPARYDPSQLRKKLSLGEKKIILFLGTPRQRKGLEELVQAVSNIRREDVRLLIVGAKMGDPFVHSLCKRNPKVLLIDMCSYKEAPLYLALADVVVLPQKKDITTIGQLPSKIMDAMAMGCAIISTAVSDIPEVLDGCGVVVPPGNVKKLKEAINTLLEDAEYARRLGERAREKCIKEYSLFALHRRLVPLIEKYR